MLHLHAPSDARRFFDGDEADAPPLALAATAASFEAASVNCDFRVRDAWREGRSRDAAALDAWLSEVVTLAKWGTLAPGVVAEVRALLHADELEPEGVIAAPAPATAAAAPRARRGGAPRRSQRLQPATFSALPQVEEAAPAAAPGAVATDVEAKARRIAELETVVASLKKRIATIDPGNDVEALTSLYRKIFNYLVVRAGLEPGAYALSWRWDCEQTPQVWNSCADITVV